MRENGAKLTLIDAMFHYRDQGEYRLHDFVVMRNHLHAQITLGADNSVAAPSAIFKGCVAECTLAIRRARHLLRIESQYRTGSPRDPVSGVRDLCWIPGCAGLFRLFECSSIGVLRFVTPAQMF